MIPRKAPLSVIRPGVLQGLVAALTHAQTLEELSAILETLPEKCGMLNFIYYFMGENGVLRPDNFTCTNYPEEWKNRYYEKDYLFVDPVVRRATQTSLPFEWRELSVEKSTPSYKMMMEGLDFNVGNAGLSIPLRSVGGSYGLFAITSENEHKFDGINRIGYAREYQILANYIHEAYVRIAAFQVSGVVELSGEERACLKLAAEGLLGQEIARRLKMPDSVVRLCLRVVRHKLGAATTEMAIRNALSLGMI
ncbi:autoinducer binding domain-containing protein [Acetobacter farinalis]|uniref:Autoinducer binding domain-containing protein n=1 Tax=Acetobacter farinalis TaxID=1260984 RepID=A0ABT3Q9H2_9PROT|nr:autoinducer binding domain-containing protein [Acetobacter farinalis]MCX2561926.1 autoinducer binding domain-containing protein [Acetobacter farinalis]NHO30502.1 hypothetical protein [Acetobacter farinalis]